MARLAFAHALYVSKAWVDLRRNLIIQRGPVCQRCSTVMVDTSKLIGHHIKPVTLANIHDVTVTLNPANVELVCLTCHNNESHHFMGSNRHSVYN